MHILRLCTALLDSCLPCRFVATCLSVEMSASLCMVCSFTSNYGRRDVC